MGNGRREILASTSALLAVLAAPALAAEPTQQRDSGPVAQAAEVIVTATRREESLQKVPLSVSAISAASLETMGVRGITDINPGQVPGVIFQPFGGTTSSTEISIRGVATNDPDQGTRELPVPIYIDGVYLGRAQGTGLELIDPERIEVLRGPQGTLFGRNAEGGAVQFVSRKPTGELGGRIAGSFGNYGYWRLRGSLDLPEIHGLKIALSGLYSDRDGLTKNVPRDSLGTGAVDGYQRRQADFSERRERGFRAAARYDAIARLVLDYSFDWSRGEDSQAYATYSGPAIPGAGPPSAALPKESIVPLYHSPFETKAMGHALTATYAASDAVTLKSITAYREASKVGYSSLGPVFNLAPAFGLSTDLGNAIYLDADQDVRQSQFSQELQFLGSWDQLQLTAGAVYYLERVTHYQHSTFFSGPGLALFGVGDFSPGPRTGQWARTKSFGAYAQATYKPASLDGKLELTAGLRYSHDRKAAERFLGPADPANPFDSAEAPLNQQADFAADRVDPAFTVKYNVASNLNVYARYAQAYRAGGVSIRSLNFTPYNQEVTKSFELGLKSQTADRRGVLNLALYQNKIYNPQFDVGESPILTQTTRTINAPVVRRVRGAEMEAHYQVTDGLALGLNYAYMTVDQPPFINPTGSPPGLVSALVLFAPKHTASLNADYKTPVSVGTLALHTDYAFASKFYVGGEVNPVGSSTPTDPIIVRQLNARIALEQIKVAGHDASIGLWGKNLLNRKDLIFAYRVPGDNVHSYNYFVDPLTYGVDVSVEF